MASKLTLQSVYKLRSGYTLPVIGFGTYNLPARQTENIVYEALNDGYRLIDSAVLYRNEKECGKGINKWLKETGNPRESVVYTTKIWDTDQGYTNAKRSIESSLELCNLGYIDLLLIHSPYPGRKLREETWRAMEEAVADKKVRSIGVCSYGVKHLEELEQYAKIPCSVNQVECHPFMARTEIIKYCHRKGIIFECFCPLTQGRRLNDPRVVHLADKYHKDPGQILLRWAVDRGTVPLPKSATSSRIKSNADIFDFSLTPEEVKTLTTNEHYVCDWDPTDCP